MGRPRKLTPRYLEHKQSGRGRAVWTDANGKQCEQLMPGPFESKESRDAYAVFLLEGEVAPKVASIAPRDGLLLAELLDAYHEHATRHYRHADGRPTSELAEVKLVIRAARLLYGQEPAADFGPLKLKAVRQGWVVARLSRKEVNRRVNIVRRIFKWAAAEELIPAATYHALTVVTGLQKGRTTARETKPIQPVADAVVNATLPHLGRYVRAMVEFQRLTGARPGEVCALRMADVDDSGDVWLFKPTHHKNTHRDQRRVIAIGPKAQAILAPFITDDPDAYLFNPAAAVAEIRAERSAARVTPRFKSHMIRNKGKRKRNPKRAPAGCYTSHSYAVAVMRACDLAFPLPADLAPKVDADGKRESPKQWKARLTPGERQRVKDWRDAHRWHPNQLRHTFATKARREHGLEAAQVLLGHSKADTTQIYAEKNERLAVSIAAKMG